MSNHVLRKAAVISAFLLLAITLAFALYTAGHNAVSANGPALTVIIDPGHGDFDPGALASDGTQEKELNLSIALKLRDMMRALGFEVVMTREDDVTLAAEDAVSVAEKKRTDTRARAAMPRQYPNSVLLSIHLNAFSDHEQHGAQLFYGIKDSRSELLCACIQDSFVRLLQPDNHRRIKQGTDSVYLLMNSAAPTALVECGFITNGAELRLLKTDNYQQQVAYAILAGFCDYLQAVSLSNS